jgi:Flp pilus assembly CpaF family ATPase
MVISVTYFKLVNASTVLCRMYNFLDHIVRILTADVLIKGLNGTVTRKKTTVTSVLIRRGSWVTVIVMDMWLRTGRFGV